MRKKLGSVVFLVTGLSALIFSDIGGNLISQASANSTAEAQKKAAKTQEVEASRITSKRYPAPRMVCCLCRRMRFSANFPRPCRVVSRTLPT